MGLVTGNTKDPGVSLFRRLKSTWHSIEVNYSSLNTFDYTSVPEWMEDQGKRVLVWAEQELQKKTWPRADYQELLQLLIICLGGEIQNFKFRLPGPDHHARWMSKCLYYLKMKLLKKQFMMTEQEQQEVEQITEFLVIFYIKAWFESPLPTSAARNDLTFMKNMLNYRLTRPTVSFTVLQSCYRHLWYLCPQTIVLALADKGLDNSQKEEMAKKLYSLERMVIKTGKPRFPVLDWSGEERRIPDMASLVTTESWLVFDLLGLTGTQVTVPVMYELYWTGQFCAVYSTVYRSVLHYKMSGTL